MGKFENDIKQKVKEFYTEYQTLEGEIISLGGRPEADHLQVERLKKRKKQLKKLISKLEGSLIPDMPA